MIKPLRWWTAGQDGLHWWLQRQPGEDDPVGEVYFKNGIEKGWYAIVHGNHLPMTFSSCRRAKLAVRRTLRGKS